MPDTKPFPITDGPSLAVCLVFHSEKLAVVSPAWQLQLRRPDPLRDKFGNGCTFPSRLALSREFK